MKTKCIANSTILTGTRQRKGMNTCKVDRLKGARVDNARVGDLAYFSSRS